MLGCHVVPRLPHETRLRDVCPQSETGTLATHFGQNERGMRCDTAQLSSQLMVLHAWFYYVLYIFILEVFRIWSATLHKQRCDAAGGQLRFWRRVLAI